MKSRHFLCADSTKHGNERLIKRKYLLKIQLDRVI